MNIITTLLPGVLIIQPQVFSDDRGHFKETYNASRYLNQAGIGLPFVQDNQVHSGKGVLRGLHFQKTHPQGKLISVSHGAVFDVVVDINPDSACFGLHVGIEISAANHRQVWVPPGYAHGYCVIGDEATLNYKCTDYYYPDDEGGLAWNCPELNIQWPVSQPLLSTKDQRNPNLSVWRQLHNPG